MTRLGDTPGATTGDRAREAEIARRRLAKAQALAKVLLEHGAVGPEVVDLPAAARRTVEQLAGVRESSDVTWAMTSDLVRARRELERRLPNPSDPFSAFGAAS